MLHFTVEWALDLVLRFLNQVDLQKVPLVAAFLCEGERDINFQNYKHYELRGMWRIGYFQGKALWNKEEDSTSMSLREFICPELGFRDKEIRALKSFVVDTL